MPCTFLSIANSSTNATNRQKTLDSSKDHLLPLLSVSADAKTIKGERIGFLTGILYLSPLQIGGGPNLCPFASLECAQACLNTAGRGAMGNVQKGRLRKTRFFLRDKSGFLARLTLDIQRLVKKAEKLGLKPCVRLNGTSDISWENVYPQLFAQFPKVQFYDYTKNPKRAKRFVVDKSWSKNYHITFSRSEVNEETCRELVEMGVNVAIVANKDTYKTLVGHYAYYLGLGNDLAHLPKLVDGDKSDLRFLDRADADASPIGKVVVLKAKGCARKMGVSPSNCSKSFVVNRI